MMVHVLVGFPGAGKTRFRKRMQRREGWRVLSRDDIRRDVFGVEFDESLEDQVSGLYWEMVYELLMSTNSQKPVCLDCTHLTKEVREQTLAAIQVSGHEAVAHVFDVDPEECWKRKKFSYRGGVRSQMSRERFDKLVASYEPVTEDEGFSKIVVHKGRNRG